MQADVRAELDDVIRMLKEVRSKLEALYADFMREGEAGGRRAVYFESLLQLEEAIAKLEHARRLLHQSAQ